MKVRDLRYSVPRWLLAFLVIRACAYAYFIGALCLTAFCLVVDHQVPWQSAPLIVLSVVAYLVKDRLAVRLLSDLIERDFRIQGS